MLGAIAILAGYVSLIVAFGWPGALAAVAHVAVMLLAMRRP